MLRRSICRSEDCTKTVYCGKTKSAPVLGLLFLVVVQILAKVFIQCMFEATVYCCRTILRRAVHHRLQYVAVRFVRARYNLVRTERRNSPEISSIANYSGDMFEDCDNDTSSSTAQFVKHIFNDTELQRFIVDFRRCFIAGSIAGGVLRSKASLECAELISTALQVFFTCTHEEAFNASARFFFACIQYVHRTAIGTVDVLPLAASLTWAISEYSLTGGTELLRELTIAVDLVLQKSIHVRDNYLQHFNAKRSEDLRNYQNRHECGNGDIPPPLEGWIAEANRTGKNFRVNRRFDNELILEEVQEKLIPKHAINTTRALIITPLEFLRFNVLAPAQNYSGYRLWRSSKE